MLKDDRGSIPVSIWKEHFEKVESSFLEINSNKVVPI